ncbi:DASH complex subunit Dad1-domain-containing protein [Podospora fimiseda]|uniref:DASH complex subunit DAD1 n=1 Tax=Podospora fimiseda TaxID=252190 RepID=A0AAN7BP71_9PEZI|nr:DASH complex subunit Dad1-domain-containing protein [Podospora fimiseda]
MASYSRSTSAAGHQPPREKTSFELQREELMSEIAISFEHVLANINKLNRSLEAVIAVGNEFASVEALWSTFENVMAKDEEHEEEQQQEEQQEGEEGYDDAEGQEGGVAEGEEEYDQDEEMEDMSEIQVQQEQQQQQDQQQQDEEDRRKSRYAGRERLYQR